MSVRKGNSKRIRRHKSQVKFKRSSTQPDFFKNANYTERSRIWEVNRLIDLDNSDDVKGNEKILPETIKLDYIRKNSDNRLYIESGIAYLEGKIPKEDMNPYTVRKLDRLIELKTSPKNMEHAFEKYIRVARDDETHLIIPDGRHRTILALARQDDKDRFYGKYDPIPLTELKRWVKQNNT